MKNGTKSGAGSWFRKRKRVAAARICIAWRVVTAKLWNVEWK